MTSFKLIYDKAAETWNNAIPLGNGRLGAMVYGNTGGDRIQLNEDSLWYGTFVDRNNRAARGKLEETRKLVLEGKIREAEDLIIRYFTGAPYSQRHYEPLGELDISLNQHAPFTGSWFPHSAGAEQYRAELDLMTGIHTIRHVQDGVEYTRETFISYPAQVLCLKLSASGGKAINLDVKLDRGLISDEKHPDDRRPGYFMRSGPWPGFEADECRAGEDGTLFMRGNAAGVRFYTALRIESDGVLENPYSMLFVRRAGEVYLYLAAATSNREEDPEGAALNLLEKARTRGYEKLIEEHIADF